MAKEYGVGLKVIWRLEDGCGDACGNPGFNSTWPDLFSEPKLRLADNFPGQHGLGNCSRICYEIKAAFRLCCSNIVSCRQSEQADLIGLVKHELDK